MQASRDATVLQLERDVSDRARELLEFAGMAEQTVPEYVYDGALDALCMRTPIVADDDRGGCRADERRTQLQRFRNHAWFTLVEEEARKLFENAIAHRVIRRIDLNSQIDRPQDTDSGAHEATAGTEEPSEPENEVWYTGAHAARMNRLRRMQIQAIGAA